MTFSISGARLMALLVVLVGLVAPAILADQTYDKHCGSNWCASVLYDTSSRQANYTLQAKYSGSSPSGWWSVGSGSSKMAGANMVLAWVNSDGTISMSQRSSTKHEQPSTAKVTAAAFQPVMSASSASAGTVTFQWIFTNVDSSSSAPHIWAIGTTTPTQSGSADSANVPEHKSYGSFSLDLTKPYSAATTSSGTSSSGSTTSSSGESEGEGADGIGRPTSTVVIVHIVVAYITWLLIIPAGILIGRFGRAVFKWVPAHRAVQSLGVLVAIAVMITGIFAVNAQGGIQVSDGHHRLGIAVTAVAVLQAILGQVGRWFNHKHGNRIINFVHIVLGLVLIAGAWINIGTGVQIFDTDDSTRRTLYIVAYVVGAVILVAYVAGFLLIPRQRRAEKEHRYSQGVKSLDSDANTPVNASGTNTPWGYNYNQGGAPQGHQMEQYGQPATTQGHHQGQAPYRAY